MVADLQALALRLTTGHIAAMGKSERGTAERLTDATYAFAGLTGGLAVLAKFAAWILAPTGFAALAVAIGFKSPPLISVAAAALAALAAILGALHGFARFWAWIRA
jgi:hypothetical protein